MDAVTKMLERDYPQLKITRRVTPESVLRAATREYAPEVADALDAATCTVRLVC